MILRFWEFWFRAYLCIEKGKIEPEENRQSLSFILLVCNLSPRAGFLRHNGPVVYCSSFPFFQGCGTDMC